MLLITQKDTFKMDHIKREVVSAIKWTWLICVAAAAFYMVTPKYYIPAKGQLRLNRVTGQVFECWDVNEETCERNYRREKSK